MLSPGRVRSESESQKRGANFRRPKAFGHFPAVCRLWASADLRAFQSIRTGESPVARVATELLIFDDAAQLAVNRVLDSPSQCSKLFLPPSNYVGALATAGTSGALLHTLGLGHGTLGVACPNTCFNARPSRVAESVVASVAIAVTQLDTQYPLRTDRICACCRF
jgi:hypothetical protein